MDIKPIHLT